ncbi:MAG: ABC transporter ATP-binding protein [Dehalococcoidia bacterium]
MIDEHAEAQATVSTAAAPLLEVRHLKKYFSIGGGLLRRSMSLKAVDDVSFTVQPGETLGLVGESGCGKSTLAQTLIRLYEPTAGEVIFQGQDISTARGRRLQATRRDMQMIFQDPYSSLDPRMTVGGIIGEPLRNFRVPNAKEQVRELLRVVGLNPYFINRYPHEFSGGQRQRIGVARAIALRPKLVICDEPVSALDVSIQAQVLNLLRDLQNDLDLSYLFIAHNLAVVAHVSDRIGVMYLGKLIELGPTEAITTDPRHPYTKALLSAVPVPDRKTTRQRIILKGEVPSPLNPPLGCRFNTRCPLAEDICRTEEPEFREIGGGRKVACHFA